MINSFDIGNIQKRSANIINANYSSYQNKDLLSTQLATTAAEE